ncbi:MAG: penicillin-binding protein 1A [Burkholderiaceae bacterium]|nr:penicillin-binding protein 1A [Burkholderiaceae bacterium]
MPFPWKKKAASPPKRDAQWWFRLGANLLIAGVGTGIAGFLIILFALVIIFPNLPPLDRLTDYRPKMPLRIYTADDILIGEFGEERRNLIRFDQIPEKVKKAVLAIEDDRFYQHSGIDFLGIARAAIHNLFSSSRQGASTITQQVARNFFLSSEQTLKRKMYEAALAWKIEKALSKDEIFEIYLNQIYLGQRAFGFAAAAQIYFGKRLQDVSIAEAAMLAGLPKAPSANNPVANPTRAKARQQYILQRMLSLGYIDNDQYKQAMDEVIQVRNKTNEFAIHAEYVAEMTRMILYEQYKEETYTRGLNVYTTVSSVDQKAAYRAVRDGVMEYDKRHGYRGPEGFLEIPDAREDAANAIEEELTNYPDSDDLLSAVVLEAAPRQVRAVLVSGEEIEITGKGLTLVASALSANANINRKIRRGAIIRVTQGKTEKWSITQMPLVESAFVAIHSADGSIMAMVGGFDFNRRKFNHVTQAWRQPGSSFKPFIYSAALEKRFAPTSIINDAPIFFSAAQTGGQPWEPKNYDARYEGPMTMRRGLMKSKNMISIRVLDQITPQYAQEYATRFGFDAAKHPPYLTLALGSGSVTPLQMATAYAVFANGGYKVDPYLISHITDTQGRVIARAQPRKAGDGAPQVIDERNAFIMDSMLKDVVRHGTAVRALALNRSDLAGKTGTTNDSVDAWFAGYQPRTVGVAWIGYDQPKNLGNRETGGGLALPIWINFMRTALKDAPIVARTVPAGVVSIAGDYHYKENPPGTIVSNVGVEHREPEPDGEEPGDIKDDIF